MRLKTESSVSLSQCLCCGSYDIVRQSWPRVSRNVVCFSSDRDTTSRQFPCFSGSNYVKHFCEDSAGLTCFAPTQRTRSHKTSRLSSRSFHGVRFKTRALSFALLASERILNAMMSWTIVTQVQAEVQAAFDRDTFGLCCQEDRIHCCDLLSQSM